ncbi:hypothetical protein CTAM01_11920 [Colletotrichum tamarilloi]|uniref:Uncharacterized protein n=1 Tax=Colletotrichum tamarilloi TaxID=1209934 RepID=A0ABQ9QWA5_9PEZI|nr:uncharacterized protein CTAM01_11920 [Colletotrichum tamarilloi]KAK1487149.1 hypothetical protein CTAM01_11920 [Colletotrichum tamarilloi]
MPTSPMPDTSKRFKHTKKWKRKRNDKSQEHTHPDVPESGSDPHLPATGALPLWRSGALHARAPSMPPRHQPPAVPETTGSNPRTTRAFIPRRRRNRGKQKDTSYP